MKKHGSFKEKGHTFTAYLPEKEGEKHAWKVVVEKDGEIVKEAYLDLMHPITWGIDVEDRARLEEFVDEVMEDL